jgi:two-component system, LuxR family, sensor kinase FixL
MLDPPRPADVRASRWVPIATVALAVVVFIVDTVTPFDINVGLFYLPVLLLGARFLQGRKLVLLAAAGAALSATSFLINLLVVRGPGAFAGGVNMLGIVIPAIALMTWLLLQGQARLRKVREQAGLVDLTRAAMFSRGMDDRIVFWNRGAEELYGWRPAEAMGKVTHDVLGTVFPEPLADINAELLRSSRWQGELVHTRRDGEKVFVESRWSLQRDEQGQPALILETNNDVTERKRAEDSLRRAEADLTRIHRVLLVGELTASIAHEINQPLAAVGANAGAALRFLGRSPPVVERAREALEMAVAENARASAIITRVRGLVKNAPIQTQVVDMNDVIRDAVALTQAKLKRHGVKLVTGLADGMAPVAADPLQLQQVLMNLVTNAVDAMDGVADRARELTITSGADGTDQALVEVRDTGPGFDAAGAERLFESFYTTKTGGMGMGLAICRSIIAAHGGRLWAAPNEPHGAVFRFALPTKVRQV